MLVRIVGGITAMEPMHASIGRDARLEAMPGEPHDVFQTRALEEAARIDAGFVVIGGPPLV
jgi:hypothetical protein